MIYFIIAALFGFGAGILVTLATGAMYCCSQGNKLKFETPAETDSKNI